jgi:hypothetical protein
MKNKNYLKSVVAGILITGSFMANAQVYTAPSGNVGIGTTATTGHKLSVEGKIRAREVFINLDTWADYVFQPSYKRLTLGELQKYINENSRLPNMPSTEEATDEPMSVGEVQVKLLEKIEELTLYILELNARIELLESTQTTE